MAHSTTIIHSINLPGEHICVDVFRRPDGTFGYGQFRRDPEDPRGWYEIGPYPAHPFTTADMALAAARQAVHWLEDVLGD